MFCTGKEQLTCNSEKLGCEGCYFNDDKNKDGIKMKNLIEELTKVNPANLSEEGLKLFNKINEIIDRNEELEKENNMLYELQLKIQSENIPKSKVEELREIDNIDLIHFKIKELLQEGDK